MNSEILRFWLPRVHDIHASEEEHILLRPYSSLEPQRLSRLIRYITPYFIIKEADWKPTVVSCVYSLLLQWDDHSRTFRDYMPIVVDLSLLHKWISSQGTLTTYSEKVESTAGIQATLAVAALNMNRFSNIPDEEKPAAFELAMTAPQTFSELAGKLAASKKLKRKRMFAIAQSWDFWVEEGFSYGQAVAQLNEKGIPTTFATFDKTRQELELPSFNQLRFGSSGSF